MTNIALLIFAVTITLVIWGIIDRSLVALIGALALGFTGVLSLEQAVHYVDWDVISILLGMWILAEYLSGAGLSDLIVSWASRKSNDYLKFLFTVAIISGFLSLFVDNVLIVVLFGGIIAESSRKAGLDPLLPVLLVSLNANFMGTALLLGDLPPQLLHSVAGAEFNDFIWMNGKPSSFPLLTITYLVLNAILYTWMKNRMNHVSGLALQGISVERSVRDSNKSLQLKVSILIFVLTIIGMAYRREISSLLGFDVKLGEIALLGGLFMAAVAEVFRVTGREMDSFENVLGRIEWSALLFYISLFILVGGLVETGFIDEAARKMISLTTGHGTLYAYSILYWFTGLSASVIEHDALILSLFNIIKDLATATGINPWPLYWSVAWSGTLGSNATMAGAPAIFVGVTIASRVSGRKYGGFDILKYTIPYAVLSLLIQYLISIVFWA
ncbi:MAG: permease [Desulfurococcales archaeon]|nr:permease [Desulfurococcales archaeon]